MKNIEILAAAATVVMLPVGCNGGWAGSSNTGGYDGCCSSGAGW